MPDEARRSRIGRRDGVASRSAARTCSCASSVTSGPSSARRVDSTACACATRASAASSDRAARDRIARPAGRAADRRTPRHQSPAIIGAASPDSPSAVSETGATTVLRRRDRASGQQHRRRSRSETSRSSCARVLRRRVIHRHRAVSATADQRLDLGLVPVRQQAVPLVDHPIRHRCATASPSSVSARLMTRRSSACPRPRDPAALLQRVDQPRRRTLVVRQVARELGAGRGAARPDRHQRRPLRSRHPFVGEHRLADPPESGGRAARDSRSSNRA